VFILTFWNFKKKAFWKNITTIKAFFDHHHLDWCTYIQTFQSANKTGLVNSPDV
jgi:hypothetical protein